MELKIDDLRGDEVRDLLEEHLTDMRNVSPPGSDHTLNLDGLRQPDVTFWTAWQEGVLVGCGALKELDVERAEIKSMRVRQRVRRGGVGAAILTALINEARRRGYRELLLETGTHPFFEPARRLYSKNGFVSCGPFGEYTLDPHSCYLSLRLERNGMETK